MNLRRRCFKVEPDPSLAVLEDPQVYRPAEDSYLLLEAVEVGGSPFLELGTGTGLVALHAARQVDAVATDVNPHAVRLARANARKNGLSLQVIRTDLFAGVCGAFDTVAFNPPYLPVRTGAGWLERSWSGGPSGNEIVLRFLREVPAHLAPSGRVYLLLSSHNEAARDEAEARFRARPVARHRLFFEELVAWELRPKGSARL